MVVIEWKQDLDVVVIKVKHNSMRMNTVQIYMNQLGGIWGPLGHNAT
jgi:hypothetical protein